MFGKDTFFTIFAEQFVIYDQIHEQLNDILNLIGANENEDWYNHKVLRRLRYVVDRPTPTTI